MWHVYAGPSTARAASNNICLFLRSRDLRLRRESPKLQVNRDFNELNLIFLSVHAEAPNLAFAARASGAELLASPCRHQRRIEVTHPSYQLFLHLLCRVLLVLRLFPIHDLGVLGLHLLHDALALNGCRPTLLRRVQLVRTFSPHR